MNVSVARVPPEGRAANSSAPPKRAAMRRQSDRPSPLPACVAVDGRDTDAVVVDEQTPRERRTHRGHVNVSGVGGNGVREQVAQDHAERPGRQRQRRGRVRRDLDLDAEILDGLREALRHRGERLLTWLAPRGLEQRIDEQDRVLDRPGRVVGGERGLERGLQLVRDERREVLERLVALGKLDRRSRQPLFGRSPPDDRRERDQRRLDLPVQRATVENEHTGRPERQAVAATASDPIDSDELERAVLVPGPPLGPRGPGVAANPSDDGVHARREVVGRRERQNHVVLE